MFTRKRPGLADSSHGSSIVIEASEDEEAPACNAAPEQISKSEQPSTSTISVPEPAPEKWQTKSYSRPYSSRKFESYDLVWEISRDALSTTYAAQRAGLEGLVAVRIFDAKATSGTQVRSIQQAASKASELTHPNHVTVYENAISASGEPYVVTELVEAESLAQIFPVVKRLNISRFLGIFNQVCEVLQEAHSRQLVHANLSPAKILLLTDECDTDTAKVIDFGMPPDPVQNAFYLSPEQCLDRSRVDARTDIYSLGCIMYEALCGSPPFVGYKMSHAALNYLHELANQYSPDAPEHNALKLLDCIIIKCLAKKPSKRFRSIRELIDALRLVNDCICNGSTKKLPPKAEKLLLFRFLDFFDKKIVACFFSYLLLGGIAVKYIGEIQLQKHIDEAQLATLQGDMPLAQASWRAAIQQADSSNKPDSLKAELHWELGNAYQKERWESEATAQTNSAVYERQNNLSKDAINEYKQALPYFIHGMHFRSCAIMLLNNIAGMWNAIAMNNSKESLTQLRDAAAAELNEIKSLYKQKKYEQCGRSFRDYLLAHGLYSNLARDQEQPLKDANDKKSAEAVACAYNELATRLPPEKALHYFERAVLYFHLSGKPLTGEANLNTCISRTKFENDGYETHEHLSWDALTQGDEEASLGELCLAEEGTSGYMKSQIEDCLNSFEGAKVIIRSASAEEIQPLQEALKLEEASFGLHSARLASTVSQLARCYQNKGQSDKALQTYKRLFDLAPEMNAFGIGVHPGPLQTTFDLDLINYADLLDQNGMHRESLKILEKYLLSASHDPTCTVLATNALYYRLAKAYARIHLRDQATDMITNFIAETYIPQPADTEPYQPSPPTSTPMQTSDDPFAPQ